MLDPEKPISNQELNEARRSANCEEAQEKRRRFLEFISYLKERGNSHETINIHLRALKAFFHWAHSQGFILSNPMQGMPMMKTPRLLVQCLTPYELQRLLEIIRRSGRNRLRNQAIVFLLLDTGMRPGELCNWNEPLKLDTFGLECLAGRSYLQ